MRKLPLLTATALLTGLLGSTPAAAAPAKEFARGTVQNQVPEEGRPMDTRTVTVNATDQGGDVSGQVSFRHVRQQAADSNDVKGLSRFRGTVECLQVDADVVRVSGTVTSGSTRTGVELTGKPYAITFDTSADQFTLPAFGDGVVDDGGECPTSSRDRVDVTSGQLRTSG